MGEPISTPPLQVQSSSMSLTDSVPKTPKSPFAFMSTPLASPMKKAIENMHGYLEEVGRFTKLHDPQDAWLPITESRNGNAYYAAFHTLCSGIGVQALVLPLAFTSLGWTWGILCLCMAFTWQLYTLWLMIQLHESDSGVRYSRYLRLAMAAFGEKLGKLMALFPIMYLSGGTCVTLIMIGGGTTKVFFQLVCKKTCTVNPPTTIVLFGVHGHSYFVGSASEPEFNSRSFSSWSHHCRRLLRANMGDIPSQRQIHSRVLPATRWRIRGHKDFQCLECTWHYCLCLQRSQSCAGDTGNYAFRCKAALTLGHVERR